jgi:2-haloacid dehalogenase
MITTIFWDVDGTLLDFDAAERAAMRTLFAAFDLGECTEELLRRYSEINVGFWRRLERGEIAKPQVLVGRFEQFFKEYGIDPSIAPAFNERYQLTLGDTIVYRDDSLNLIKRLKGRVKQYVVSNGTVAAQTKKLRRSGLGEWMDGVFLSEGVGFEKPDVRFFDAVFAAIGPVDRSEVMIVGDSLTSDMQGGRNAGIGTCWYDPERKPVPEGYRVDHVIADLGEIFALLDSETAEPCAEHGRP